MKLTKYVFAPLLISLCILVSCNKSFLDKVPHNAVPLNTAITTEGEMSTAVNGLYASLRNSAFFGQAIPLMGDLLADNVYISPLNSGRYIEFNTYSFINSDSYVTGIWQDCYNSILSANIILNATVSNDQNVSQLRGETYTLRALLYFELVNFFSGPYRVADTGNMGVPLVLIYNPDLMPSRNSIGQVYTQILSDLDSAVNLLNTQKNSEYISPYTAMGLKAKVYQYMGDWVDAKTAALNVVNNSGYSLVDSANYVPFWQNPGPSTQSETLFEISIDSKTSNGYNSIDAIYDQNGYGDALCDSTLYSLYDSADVRIQLIYQGARGNLNVYVVNKYQNLNNQNDQDDIKVLRLAEVYLILAEACYNTGDNANALIYLNTVAQMRQPSFVGYTASGTSLLNAITNERRKELAFEGNRFFDMNRLGLDVNRDDDYPTNALTISASDHHRIMPIPLSEMNANTNMKQNPGY